VRESTRERERESERERERARARETHADGAETSRSEDEGKLHQAAAPMSKLQGPAGDYINAKISPALGTAALNRTAEEDLRREVAETATKLAEAQRQSQVLPTTMSHGGSPTIKQPDPMVKIKNSQPTQGKSAESPQGALHWLTRGQRWRKPNLPWTPSMLTTQAGPVRCRGVNTSMG